MPRLLTIIFLTTLVTGLNPAPAQAPPAIASAKPARPTPPTRDPHTPGYVTAKDLPDGAVPSPKEDGNFILGTTHNPAPEMAVKEGAPQGTIYNFPMEATDSKFYPGIARDPSPGGQPGPPDP